MEKASTSPSQLIEGDEPLPDLEMEPEMHLSYVPGIRHDQCIAMLITYRSTLALSAAALRTREARESESIVVLEGLARAQPGPIPATLLSASTFVVTVAWARETAFGIPLIFIRTTSWNSLIVK
jgi:hypothetical protein